MNLLPGKVQKLRGLYPEEESLQRRGGSKGGSGLLIGSLKLAIGSLKDSEDDISLKLVLRLFFQYLFSYLIIPLMLYSILYPFSTLINFIVSSSMSPL